MDILDFIFYNFIKLCSKIWIKKILKYNDEILLLL